MKVNKTLLIINACEKVYSDRSKTINLYKRNMLSRLLDKTNADKFIAEFSVLPYNKSQATVLADRYSSDAGTYYFLGRQFEFDELVDLLMKNCFIIKCDFTYEEEI